MPNSSDLKQNLLAAIDKVIQQGHWDGSLFFKNILKRLLLIREAVMSELSEASASAEAKSQDAAGAVAKPDDKPGYRKVYITIYQTESDRIDKWNSVIKALEENCMSRPIYQSEAEAQDVIRNKHSHTDAYVTVWVKDSNVLQISNNEKLHDRFGHELIVLKEGSVKLPNVIEFWHEGKLTPLKQGQLQ